MKRFLAIAIIVLLLSVSAVVAQEKSKPAELAESMARYQQLMTNLAKLTASEQQELAVLSQKISSLSKELGATEKKEPPKQEPPKPPTTKPGGISDAEFASLQQRYAPLLKDMDIYHSDILGSAPNGFYGEDFSVTEVPLTPGTFFINSGGEYDPSTGKMSGDYASEIAYFDTQGKKQILGLKLYEDGKQTKSYQFGIQPGTTWKIDDKTVGTVVKIGEDTFLKLDTVNGVDIVRDKDGDIKYYRNGKELTDEEEDKFEDAKENKEKLSKLEDLNDEIDDAEKEKRLRELSVEQREQFASVRIFLNTFVSYYSQFAGLAGWSALIFDEEFLKDWREKVNFIMCDTLHLPTKECWTSKICGKYADIKPSRDGVLFSTSVGGAPQAVVHIEGQRAMPIVLPNGTMWGYAVTFGLTNPTDEDMSYNVRFSGQRSVTWWDSSQTIGGGGRVNALGAAALYKLSATEYGQVCLEFSPSITGFGGKKVSKMCNDIVQYAGGATAPYPTPENATQPGAPTPGAPAPGQPAPPGSNI